MESDIRSKMQIYRQEKVLLESVPYDKEIIRIESIGNHNRGTKFINSNHLISKKLVATFDKLALEIPDFHYGRFDIKYQSFEELEEGKNFKILELNGSNSEPTHIYDQSNGLMQSLKDMAYHWKIMANIYSQLHKKGFQAISTIKLLKILAK